MTLPVPKLDTTDFEQLVETARSLIPRYAPGWTDHNLHDPGMTLIDLLAFVVDQQVYRAGFVGDRHLRAFAALLGERPRGPSAAEGLIWPGSPLSTSWQLSRGTSVECTRQPEVPFVLSHDHYLSDSRLERALLVRDGVEVPLTGSRSRYRASVALAPARPGGIATLVLHFDRALWALDAPDGVALSVGFALDANPSALARPSSAFGPLVFEYRVRGGDWLELDLIGDTTDGLARTGVVRLRSPGVFAAGPSSLRLRLDRPAAPVAPQLQRTSLNVLSAIQLDLQSGSVVGRGTGLPDQSLALDTRRLLDARDGWGLEISVPEGGAPVPWSPVPDFSRSGPSDRHYVREPRRILFGNGVNGRNPPLGAQILRGPLAQTLGREGNLRAGLAWGVPGIEGLPKVYGENPVAMAGGAEAWDGERLLEAARVAATARCAHVTNRDLIEGATGLPGFALARAEVLAGFDRRLPARVTKGVRTLVVLPDREPRTPPSPVPPAYTQSVRAALEPHRILGERLLVQAPRYRHVALHVTLIVRAGAVVPDTIQAVAERLGARFWDVRRISEVEPWPLGRRVTCGEVQALAAGVDDVAAVTSCRIGRVGEPAGSEPIELARDEIAIALSEAIQIEARA